jgi:EAL domain-containing protein (putative c-di-GMP-specific phosphodiesterase class I)
VLRSVAHLKRENERLRAVAFVDPKTGLATSVRLEEAIGESLPKATFEAPAAFFLFDVDRFGNAVEELGAQRAEFLMALVADRLKSGLDALPPPHADALQDAVLAHINADEYALWLPKAISRDHVTQIARAVRQAFIAPFESHGHMLSLTLSGGIVMAPEDADSFLNLRAYAELALKNARHDTGSGFRFFSPRFNRFVRGRYQLEAEIREGINNREFRPVFQPKIDFTTGRIVGAEALARWRRANGQVISPAAFIPVAEESGLITQIGEQILEEACLAARGWLDQGFEIAVAVNVSPRQFQKLHLAVTIADILTRTGLPPHLLELEITESMAVSNPAIVADVMRPLREMGVKLAIDDFGTGHSNLATLTRLPFDVFKIDQQFVGALETDRQAPAIVEMILAMAETLGLKTVAEGVETVRQAEFLRRRGCTMAQGYLYSPGLANAAFLDLVSAWSPGAEHAVFAVQEAG